MSNLTLGVIGTPSKPDEKRAPIDPAHIPQIPEALRRRMWFQRGYGERFGVSDEEIAAETAGVLDTEDLYGRCDVVLIAKPTAADLPSFREGQIIWGWPHCVQGEAITQEAIDKKLTLIAWEAMNLWPADGVRGLHVFHMNNELAGYCAVLHAMALCGRTGRYGKPLRAAVLEFGLTARGAIHGLQALGFPDVTCYTQRRPEDLPGQIGCVTYQQYARRDDGAEVDGIEEAAPMGEVLAGYDVVVNCIFQDTDRPVMFVRTADLIPFRGGSLLIDVSCDEGLGFDFARPTSFQDPLFEAGHGVLYYGVDHTPSYLWRASTYEISRALLPYLQTVMDGPNAWDAESVIHNAIEIRGGEIVNPKILTRQRRSPAYPHARV